MRAVVFAGTLLIGVSPGCHAPPAPVAAAAPVDPRTCEHDVSVDAEFKVNSPPPKYPEALGAKGIDGEVEAMYIVNSRGMVDTASFQVLKSSDTLFTAAVRAALPGMRFVPAMTDNRPVCQRVQQTFLFSPGKGG